MLPDVYLLFWFYFVMAVDPSVFMKTFSIYFIILILFALSKHTNQAFLPLFPISFFYIIIVSLFIRLVSFGPLLVIHSYQTAPYHLRYL